jgi:quinol-cytochrome oxidoreductase complex cytochrome b subunit
MTGRPPAARSQSFLEHVHPRHLPAWRVKVSATFCLGGTAFFCFVVLGLSGLLLMFFYRPTPAGAYASLVDLNGAVPFGWWLRRLHFWAGQAMVFVLIGHMIRVVWQRAFAPPRHLNWLVGTALLMLTLALDLTGYLLRADVHTWWAAEVAVSLGERVPLIGDQIRSFFLPAGAGRELGLLRFYVLHCLALPGLALGLMLYHFWRVRRDGPPPRL